MRAFDDKREPEDSRPHCGFLIAGGMSIALWFIVIYFALEWWFGS